MTVETREATKKEILQLFDDAILYFENGKKDPGIVRYRYLMKKVRVYLEQSDDSAYLKVADRTARIRGVKTEGLNLSGRLVRKYIELLHEENDAGIAREKAKVDVYYYALAFGAAQQDPTLSEREMEREISDRAVIAEIRRELGVRERTYYE